MTEVDYRSADDELFALFEVEAAQFLATATVTPFKESYRALFGFILKCNALKNGVFDSVDTSNPYTARVLFRCLCEHYLKFTHIYLRHIKEKNDDAADSFFTYCGASEMRDYAKALELSEQLIGHSVTADVNAMLCEFYPKASGLSNRELAEKSGEFSYREILRSLSSSGSGVVSEKIPFLARIVPIYAELSAFVHGGPMADAAMASFAHPSEKERCHEFGQFAFLITASVYSFTAMAVATYHPEFRPLASRIHALLSTVFNGTYAPAQDT